MRSLFLCVAVQKRLFWRRSTIQVQVLITAGLLRRYQRPRLAGCYACLHPYPYPVLIPLHHLAVEPVAALLPVNPAAVGATHLVRIMLQTLFSLPIACGTLPGQRTLGIQLSPIFFLAD